MAHWTADQVLALAPDSASASAGQGLASARKWSSLGQSDRAVWGLCQGSGKDPYQSRIDLVGPTFKCSCPSRKFPCKHGLGLLLMYAKSESSFKKEAEPGWVADWLASRQERAEKKEEKVKAAAEKPVDPVAQAKRQAQRDSRVQDGVSECRVWLEDLIRRGLAAARTESDSHWQRASARMVDAQCTGLAGMIRRIPELLTSGKGWEVRTLDWLGRMNLLIAAAARVSELPPPLQFDVRTALGFNQARDDALSQPAVSDTWAVVGQAYEEDERLRIRRSWLVGRSTARRALILEFTVVGVPGASSIDATLVSGSQFLGELAFYPSSSPLRAVVKSKGDAAPCALELGSALDPTLDRGLERFARALAANPWTSRLPLVTPTLRPIRMGETWALMDADRQALPLSPRFASSINLWRLLTISRGEPLAVCAEWDGEFLTPLAAAFSPGHMEDLAQKWVA